MKEADAGATQTQTQRWEMTPAVVSVDKGSTEFRRRVARMRA